MHVGFVYDLRADYLALGFSAEQVAEFDTITTIDAIANGLERLGCVVTRIGQGQALAARLVAGERWDLIFSIAEGLQGRSREAQVPALCELFAQPYAFSDPLTMAATLDKPIAKILVQAAGVPTAPFAVLRSPELARELTLPFPLFVKPMAEGTGKGIDGASMVQNAAELAQVATRLCAQYQQPALVETYLPGREFTIGLVGNGAASQVIGVIEILVRPDAAESVYGLTNKAHWETTVQYRLVTDPIAQQAASYAHIAYQALECRDCARIDFRCDATGVPMFLEANPLPGLQPTYSDLPIVTDLAGYDYAWLLKALVSAAASRYGLALPLPGNVPTTAHL
jgi:D-alanine-D-alanine ligase